jgi:exonuclease VII large subunit
MSELDLIQQKLTELDNQFNKTIEDVLQKERQLRQLSCKLEECAVKLAIHPTKQEVQEVMVALEHQLKHEMEQREQLIQLLESTYVAKIEAEKRLKLASSN